MAMPKKHSRNIIVDDKLYRWRIRGRQTYSQLLGSSNLQVAIELVSEGSITTLVVDTSALRAGSVYSSPDVSVTPAVVEAYIRLALRQGWKPETKGKPFLLVADESMVTGKV